MPIDNEAELLRNIILAQTNGFDSTDQINRHLKRFFLLRVAVPAVLVAGAVVVANRLTKSLDIEETNE